MKALLIYDSIYGNTEKIAKAVGKELGCEALHVSAASPSSLKNISLLIIGSPTHGGNETPALQKFIASLPKDSLQGVRVAAFDTWMTQDGQGLITKFAVGFFSHASPRTLFRLQKLGGTMAAEPAAFLVKGKEGPLLEGEIEKAREWAKKLDKS